MLPIFREEELFPRGGILSDPFFTNLFVALIDVSIEYYIKLVSKAYHLYDKSE